MYGLESFRFAIQIWVKTFSMSQIETIINVFTPKSQILAETFNVQWCNSLLFFPLAAQSKQMKNCPQKWAPHIRNVFANYLISSDWSTWEQYWIVLDILRLSEQLLLKTNIYIYTKFYILLRAIWPLRKEIQHKQIVASDSLVCITNIVSNSLLSINWINYFDSDNRQNKILC